MISTLSQALEVIAQKDAHIGELIRKNESIQRQLTTLQHQMEQVLRRLYGRKSEQLNPKLKTTSKAGSSDAYLVRTGQKCRHRKAILP